MALVEIYLGQAQVAADHGERGVAQELLEGEDVAPVAQGLEVFVVHCGDDGPEVAHEVIVGIAWCRRKQPGLAKHIFNWHIEGTRYTTTEFKPRFTSAV